MDEAALKIRDDKSSVSTLNLNLFGIDSPDEFVRIKTIEKTLDVGLCKIEVIRTKTESIYEDLLKIDSALKRVLVSFQSDKTTPIYRWYKFKEAFSSDLVKYLLEKYSVIGGILLDPFAGSGTALFASSNTGISVEGIELLPIGQQIINTKKIIYDGLNVEELAVLEHWATSVPWRKSKGRKKVPELRITKGAYPEETIILMEQYLHLIDEESQKVTIILMFALLCVLENISFTRKDGQYLRWDHRSERRQGKRPFNKGHIPDFDDAISKKLQEIVFDLAGKGQNIDMFAENCPRGNVVLHSGSCLDILPNLPVDHYNCIITSPPYCNRYDYTRTYALELALLGVDETRLRQLRQDMLSCTVENRSKDLIGMNPNWVEAISAADEHELLQSILCYLNEQKMNNALNNNGIPRMVRGYFYEMACVIYECSRVLKIGAPFIMVNDNVRYAGVSIPVDLILSDIATKLGFSVDQVLVLPKGKGNSS